MIYEQVFKKYVPLYIYILKKKKFNGNCNRGKKKRDGAWMKIQRKPIQRRKEQTSKE